MDLTVPPRGQQSFPVDSSVPNPAQTSEAERGNPVSSPARAGEPQGDLMECGLGRSEEANAVL